MIHLLLFLLACTPPKQQCTAYMYCCSWECTTRAEHEDKGPDPCDCIADSTEAAPGACVEMGEGCGFEEP